MLYRRKAATTQVVLSNSHARTIALQAVHDNPTAAHFGSANTMERLKTYAWWPSMQSDCEEYCQSCEACGRANKATGKRYGKMILSKEPTKIWQVIHWDFCTGFPPSVENSYNAIAVLACRHSHRTRILGTHDTLDAECAAWLYYRNLCSIFGL